MFEKVWLRLTLCRLLRHAESQGNVDKTTYCNVPDHTGQYRQYARKARVLHRLRSSLACICAGICSSADRQRAPPSAVPRPGAEADA